MNEAITIPRWSPKLQRLISHTLFVLWWPLLWLFLYGVMGYRLKNRLEIKKELELLTKKSPGPFFICSNHLTLIDSMIIQQFFGDFNTYLVNFDQFIWSLPEEKNFYKNLFLKCVSYLGKCILVKRGAGNLKKQNIHQQLEFLGHGKQLLSIFPEGTRSRTGKIIPQETTYGVGELLDYFPKATIICFYLRGKTQKSYSALPKRGEYYQGYLKPIKPSSNLEGRKRHKDLSLQIINQLKIMEEDHFARNEDWARPS